MKISTPVVKANSLPVSLQMFSFWVENRKFGVWQAAHASHSVRSEVEAEVLATYNANLTSITKFYLQNAIS